MTKEGILAMGAGGALNYQVCLGIFEGKTFGSCKPYSTDISAAWQVVEKMRELDYDMSLLLHTLGAPTKPRRFWYCDFRSRGKITPPECEWVDYENTAPEAICKAALLAQLGRAK